MRCGSEKFAFDRSAHNRIHFFLIAQNPHGNTYDRTHYQVFKLMPDPLLNIARQAFRNHGAKMTMAQIAEAAGVSRATVYLKLGSKTDLLMRLAEEHGQPDLATDMDTRIMEGLQETVARTGLLAASIDEIAAAAGVGAATIYRRFGDKDALIRAFVTRHAPVADTADLPVGTGSVRAQIEALTGFLLRYLVEHKAMVRLVYSGSTEDRAYLQTLRDAETSTFAQISRFFRKHQATGAIDPTIAPQDLAANLFGMLYAHAILSDGRKSFEFKAVHAAILRMFDAVIVGEDV